MCSEIRSTAQTIAKWVMLAVLLIASSGVSLVIAGKSGVSTITTAQEEVEERVPFACQRRSAIRRAACVAIRAPQKQSLRCCPITSLTQVHVLDGHRIAGGLMAPILC